jgi:flavin reductase (DIM6/NTAB) family NADH-FMN oxidoreductase RutF
MSSLSFKDVMSAVPTSVSLISCIEGDKIYGCTISSLVSLDISDTSSKIAFMLKKDSLVGKTIITNKNFSINVLNAEQELLARYYSNVRSPDTIGENKWDILNDKFAHIKNARIVLDCEYHDIFDEYPANIYVARVVDSSVNKALLPLIYESRSFINLNK